MLITNQVFTDLFYSFLRVIMRKLSNVDMNMEASNYHAKEALMRQSIKMECRDGFFSITSVFLMHFKLLAKQTTYSGTSVAPVRGKLQKLTS